MAGHVHAALMAEYAEVAKTNDKPWEEFEYLSNSNGRWYDMPECDSFDVEYKYRRKPRTININGFEVPEPLRVALDFGEKYYIASIYAGIPTICDKWKGSVDNYTDLGAGVIHKTREAAQAHAKALLSFTTTVKE